MKRLVSVIIAFALLVLSYSAAYADKPIAVDSQGVEISWSSSGCTNIQSGLLKDSAGRTLTTGYDEFGYNYQAHMFNGTYDSVDRALDGKYWGYAGDYVDDKLMMKWSDDWLANVDCNGDGKLDRGLVNGVVGGISLGWETNHVEGDYIGADGALQHYTDFVKIVWVGPGGDLWGQYTIVEEIYNDPAGGNYRFRTDPGLGQH